MRGGRVGKRGGEPGKQAQLPNRPSASPTLLDRDCEGIHMELCFSDVTKAKFSGEPTVCEDGEWAWRPPKVVGGEYTRDSTTQSPPLRVACSSVVCDLRYKSRSRFFLPKCGRPVLPVGHVGESKC